MATELAKQIDEQNKLKRREEARAQLQNLVAEFITEAEDLEFFDESKTKLEVLNHFATFVEEMSEML